MEHDLADWINREFDDDHMKQPLSTNPICVIEDDKEIQSSPIPAGDDENEAARQSEDQSIRRMKSENDFALLLLPNEIIKVILSKLPIKDRCNWRIASRRCYESIMTWKLLKNCGVSHEIIFDNMDFFQGEFLDSQIKITSKGMAKYRDRMQEHVFLKITAKLRKTTSLIRKSFTEIPKSIENLHVRFCGEEGYKNPHHLHGLEVLRMELERRRQKINHVLMESRYMFVFIPLFRKCIELGCTHFDINFILSMRSGRRFVLDWYDCKDWLKIPLWKREDLSLHQERCEKGSDLRKEELLWLIKKWHSGELQICNLEMFIVMDDPIRSEDLSSFSVSAMKNESPAFTIWNSRKSSEISIRLILNHCNRVCYALWTSKSARCPRLSFIKREAKLNYERIFSDPQPYF